MGVVGKGNGSVLCVWGRAEVSDFRECETVVTMHINRKKRDDPAPTHPTGLTPDKRAVCVVSV